MSANTIPVVDLADLGLLGNSEPSLGTVKRVVQELDAAFSTVGFVYLKNHGIKRQLIDGVFRASEDLFKLPMDLKQKFLRSSPQMTFNGKNYCGYLGPNQDILGVTDNKVLQEIRETYDVQSLNGTFPDEDAPEFRRSVTAIMPDLCRLTQRLLLCLSKALGLAEDFLANQHVNMFDGSGKNASTFRSLYYPPLNDSELQPGTERCGQHADYGTITLLFQDDMGGLEVLSKGEWIPATPMADTVLVNLGEMMQFWTSDRYTATVHRVRVPEEEIRRKLPRKSLAFFIQPDDDVVVAPLDGSSKYPPITSTELLQFHLSQTVR